MVTPVAPVNAVNIAHAITATIARPPGSQPSNALLTRTSRCGAGLSGQEISGEREQRYRDQGRHVASR